jgi:broad specificity phosphatase PhoE
MHRPVRLSPTGRQQAAELGTRRRGWPDAVFTSDQSQAIETALIAFPGAPLPIVHDPRLRECNYGDLNGSPAATLPRLAHVETPFPHGESYRQAVARVAECLAEVRQAWDGRRVLMIGHAATRLAVAHLLTGADLAELIQAPFTWQPGWSYTCSR